MGLCCMFQADIKVLLDGSCCPKGGILEKGGRCYGLFEGLISYNSFFANIFEVDRIWWFLFFPKADWSWSYIDNL